MFMPKPVSGINGSGLHLHQSLFREDSNGFYDADDEQYLSMLGKQFSEKLLVYVAADLARKRQGRGLKLNVPESVTLITEAILEAASDGKSAPEVMELGRPRSSPTTKSWTAFPNWWTWCRSKQPSRTARSWSPSTTRSRSRSTGYLRNERNHGPLYPLR